MYVCGNGGGDGGSREQMKSSLGTGDSQLIIPETGESRNITKSMVLRYRKVNT